MRTLSSFLYCSILLWCIVGEALAYGLSNEDKDHCPMDDSWPSIHIDSEYYISCPDEMLGAVSRRCVKIDNAPAWLEPNTTNCYHKSVLSSAPNGMLYSVIALNVNNISVIYNTNEQEILRRTLVNFTDPLLSIPNSQVFLTNCEAIESSRGEDGQISKLVIHFYIACPSDFVKTSTNSIMSFLNNLKGTDFAQYNDPYLLNSVFSVDKNNSYIIEKTDNLLTIILIVIVVFLAVDVVSYLAYIKIKNMQKKANKYNDEESIYSRMIE